MAELHLISNGSQELADFAVISGEIEPWVTAVHLREKDRTASELWEGVQLLRAAGVPHEKVYINDRADVAYAAGVKGLQLAWHSLDPQVAKRCFPSLRVGRSVHSRVEAEEMARRGADYLIFGHVFTSGSKPGLEPRGVDALAKVCASVNVPVIAIGGVTLERVAALISAGAAGIAVMSGILDAADPVATAKEYRSALDQALRE